LYNLTVTPTKVRERQDSCFCWLKMGRDRTNEFLNVSQALATSTNKTHKVRQKQVNPQLHNAVKISKSILEIEDRVTTIAKCNSKQLLY
jgi:hypothetical protein